MTALVIVAALLLIVVSVGLWKSKHWQFERAFFVALVGVVILGLYAIQQDGQHKLQDQAKVREAALQEQASETDRKIVLAMIISCEQTYSEIGGPLNDAHKEIRKIANAAAKDARARLANENLTATQKAQAQRALDIWDALGKAARPVPKKDCSTVVPKELRPVVPAP